MNLTGLYPFDVEAVNFEKILQQGTQNEEPNVNRDIVKHAYLGRIIHEEDPNLLTHFGNEPTRKSDGMAIRFIYHYIFLGCAV